MNEGPVVRAKFVVSHITTTEWERFQSVEVTLQARSEGTLPEDKRFSEATPCGELKMTVTNRAALSRLKVGAVFYLDFVPAPEDITAFHT